LVCIDEPRPHAQVGLKTESDAKSNGEEPRATDQRAGA
jgi:hypothetical protein